MAATTEEVPRPYGRGTSSVVSFVMALNRLNVVVVTTIFVLHVGVIGHYVPCRHNVMFPRRSYHARLRAKGVRGGLATWARGLGGRSRSRPPAGQQRQRGPSFIFEKTRFFKVDAARRATQTKLTLVYFQKITIFQGRRRPQGNTNKTDNRLFSKNHEFSRSTPPERPNPLARKRALSARRGNMKS